MVSTAVSYTRNGEEIIVCNVDVQISSFNFSSDFSSHLPKLFDIEIGKFYIRKIRYLPRVKWIEYDIFVQFKGLIRVKYVYNFYNYSLISSSHRRA